MYLKYTLPTLSKRDLGCSFAEVYQFEDLRNRNFVLCPDTVPWNEHIWFGLAVIRGTGHQCSKRKYCHTCRVAGAFHEENAVQCSDSCKAQIHHFLVCYPEQKSRPGDSKIAFTCPCGMWKWQNMFLFDYSKGTGVRVSKVPLVNFSISQIVDPAKIAFRILYPIYIWQVSSQLNVNVIFNS